MEIRTHLLVLGQFRTNILSPNKKIDKLSSSTIADYDVIKQELACRHASTDGLQPGDPKRAVERILDIARCENLTESELRTMPLRIPFGSDAIDVMRRKCEETLASIDGWDGFAASTDFPPAETPVVPKYF